MNKYLEFLQQYIEYFNTILQIQLPEKMRNIDIDISNINYQAQNQITDTPDKCLTVEVTYFQGAPFERKSYCIIRQSMVITNKDLNHLEEIENRFYRKIILELLMWSTLSKDCELRSGPDIWGRDHKFYSANTLITKGIEI